MRRLICTNTGQSIELTNRIAASGEGEVWATSDPTMLAKIYWVLDSDRLRKLQVMLAFPPKDPNRALNHVSFAWPQSLLAEPYGSVVGFLMPKISNSIELINVYNPRRRKAILPGFNWLYLHTTALNVASLIWRLHETGFVLGDIKPQNILVNSQALPSIIDTDSFQVRHPETGEVFPCRVGSEGFTPRELLGKDLATVEQTEIHDRFRLGVMIYLLLFGEHPFKGQWVGAGDSPEPGELVEKGFWPFAPNSFIRPSPLTIPLVVAHPQVKDSFLRCFNDGHDEPFRRPSAKEWVSVLNTAIDDLKACWRDRHHYYSASYGRCTWCDRRRKLGIDVFNVKEIPASPKPLVNVSTKPPRQPSSLQKNQPALSQLYHNTPTLQTPQSTTGRMPQSSVQRITGNRGWGRSPHITPSSPWGKLAGGMGGLLGVFLVLIYASSFEMSADEIGLTLAGVFACLGLMLLGFLWLRFLNGMQD